MALELYGSGVAVHNELATPEGLRWGEKDTWIPLYRRGVTIRSRIDRIDRIGEKRWQIIDWKTGRFDPDDVTDAQLDLAHAGLRTSFRAALKSDHTVLAKAINLRAGREPRVRELERQDAAATVTYYSLMAKRMQAHDDWTATPGPFCGICRWQPQCPQGSADVETELDWLDEDDALDVSDGA